MLLLRALLVSSALESARESIPDPPTETAVRWRRLKSMVDDSNSLFRRMVFDYAGKAVDNFEYPRHDPNSTKQYPIEPGHVVVIATWLYTNHVFPACRNLLFAVIENDTNKSNGIKILETCYNCLSMLATLLALDGAAVDQKYANPSRTIEWVLECIESQSTGEFFDMMRVAQGKLPCKDDAIHNSTDDEEEMVCHPWDNRGPGLNVRGTSLGEDLLLYPSIRKTCDKSDKASSATFHDNLGIALIAYWKLRAQAQDRSDSPSGLEPFPYPYSTSYRWALLFPHIETFLSASQASSTIRTMDELDCLSQSDTYLVGINFTNISLGFDMLHTLISKTPAIRPMSCRLKIKNSIIWWAHSALGLESTITELFSHVVRISSLEASIGNKPASEVYPALKYSSFEVINMARALLGFYDPAIQIQTLSMVCKSLRSNRNGVLLPVAFDFMRPIITEMSKNIEQYNNQITAVEDMAVAQSISEILDVFLVDLNDVFDDSAYPLPKDGAEYFTSFGEMHSSIFGTIRLLRLIWMSRCQAALKAGLVWDEELSGCFAGIVKWMNGCLGKLQRFDSSLTRLINFWQSSEDPPADWHRLYLMQLSLQDAMKQPNQND